MGTIRTIKQDDFSQGMQSDTKNKNLVGQTQVFGASKLKHFEIYKTGKLQPQPSFERFNTDLEKAYKIGVVGGKEDSTLYGLGEGLNNWYGTKWNCRIRINAASTSTDADYVVVDLSQLGNDFWNNVKTDGSDVRITTVSGSYENNVTFIKDFDSVAKTGFALCNIYTVNDLYVYFCNPDATAISDTTIGGVTYGGYDTFFNEEVYLAYTLNNTIEDFGRESVKSTTRYPLDNGTPAYATGKFSNAISNCNISSDLLPSVGDEASISFLFKMNTNPSSTQSIFTMSNDSLSMDVLTDGKLRFELDTADDGNVTVTSSASLSTGVYHYITVSYDKNDGTGFTAYVDGVEFAANSSLTGNLDDNFDPLSIGLASGMSMQMFTHIRNNSKPEAQRIAEGLMHSSSSFWTAQTLENYTDITPAFSGIAIYTKEVSGTAWIELLFNGQVVKDITSNNFVVPAFIDIDVNGGLFFLSSINSALNGNIYGGRATFGTTLIDTESLLLPPREIKAPLQTKTYAFDKEHYISNGAGAMDVYAGIEKTYKYVDQLDNDVTVTYPVGFTKEVYDPFPIVTSSTNYGYALAMTGTRQGRASIEIWNLLGLDPDTVIDLGTGNAKVIANVKGSLVTVVDNYLQSEVLSRGKPTLDFRLWKGKDNVKTLQSFAFDNVDTVYSNSWEYAIDNKRSDLHNASVFYAEPKVGMKGMWAIGTGEKTDQFGISIMYDTETIGRTTSHHSIGNNLVVVGENYEMHKLNGDGKFDQNSVFESMVIDAGFSGREKSIDAFEIVLDKDLPAGQVVTLEYSTDGGSFETVGTCTDKVTEFTFANGAGFNNFNEMILRITSREGDANINEWSARVEFTDEVV